MSERALKLAFMLSSGKKNNFYSDINFYGPAIKSSLLLVGLSKYAQSPKLLSILDRLGVSDNIRSYILSLPGDYQGVAVGTINKKRNIELPELQGLVNDFKAKEELKHNTNKNIEKELPNNINPNLKSWMVLQIKKYPDEKKFTTSYWAEIEWFVDKYSINLASYNIKDLRQAMHQSRFLKSEETGIENSSLDQFFHRIIEREGIEETKIENSRLLSWAVKQFFRIKKEWRANIEKTMKRSGKTFEQILGEGQAIMQAQQAGQFRGQEMPETPLHNGEHALLMVNLEGINDWYENSAIEIRDNENHPLHNLNNLSVSAAVEGSKKWHEEQKKAGNGKDYDPIDSGNIVYGPDNWKDDKNKGYFIIELKSDNDLKTEGWKMSHCVGGYCDQRRAGTTRIFSLRNNSDPMAPILTIETDPSGLIVRQDYGPDNTKVDKKYHDMVDEWNRTQASYDNIDVSNIENKDLEKVAEKTENPNILQKILELDVNRYITYLIPICIENKHISDKSLLYIMDKYLTQYLDDIAKKPNLSENIINKIFDISLENLENDGSNIAIIMLIKTKQLSNDKLIKLIDNGNHKIVNYILTYYFNDKEIINEIKNNFTNTTSQILVKIIEAKSSEELSELYAEEVSNDGNIFLTQAILLILNNPNCSKENMPPIVYKAAHNREIREKLIENPLLNEEEIITLLESWSYDNMDEDKINRALGKLSFNNLQEVMHSYKTYAFVSQLAGKEIQKRKQEKTAMKKISKDLERPTITPGSMIHPQQEEQSPISLAPVSQDSRPRVDKNGIKRHYNSFGKLHRMDGPAVISPDGNSLYYQNGKLHREDGPAATFLNGTSKWYMEGEELSPIEVLQLLINKGKISIHDIETLKELAEIAFLNYNKTDIHSLKQAGALLVEKGIIPSRNIHNVVAYLRAAQKL